MTLPLSGTVETAEALHAAVGQVWTRLDDDSEFQPTGSCVFVTIGDHEGLFALTAAHTLITDRGVRLGPDHVHLRFGGVVTHNLEIVVRGDRPDRPSRRQLPDLALLQVRGVMPLGVRPLPVRLRELNYLLRYGVPLAMAGIAQGDAELIVVPFSLTRPHSRTRTFECSNQAQLGMSGGAVVEEGPLHRLVGIISAIRTSPPRTFVTQIADLVTLLRAKGPQDLYATVSQLELSSEPGPRHLCPLPPLFENRESELTELGRLPGARKYRAVVIQGSMGSGKSTLVRRWVDGLPAGRFDKVLWYRLPRSEHEPMDGVVCSLLRHLGFEDRRIAAFGDRRKLREIQGGLGERSFLLVLDGVEALRGGGGESGGENQGEIQDPVLSGLLKSSAGWPRSRMIVTTNLALAGLDGLEVKKLALANLGAPSGVRYLRGSQLLSDVAKIEGAAACLGWNVGMLRVLAAYLRRVQGGSVKGQAVRRAIASDEPAEAFGHILEAYWKSLSATQQEFLRRLSTRPDGVYREQLERLYRPSPKVKVGRELTPRVLDEIEKLANSALIEIERHPGGRFLYRANPLCEGLFVRQRGEAENRVWLTKKPLVAETRAEQLKWNPLLSIPHTRKPSKEIDDIIEYLERHDCQEVIDWGCGNGRHVTKLCEGFDAVWAVDLEEIRDYGPFQKALPRLLDLPTFKGFKTLTNVPEELRADAVLLLFVIHTLPSVALRQKLLRRVKKHLEPGGLLVLLVPGPKEKYYKKKLQSPEYEDGLMMKRGKRFSFYREYSPEELRIFVEDNGFEFVDTIAANHKYILVFRPDR